MGRVLEDMQYFESTQKELEIFSNLPTKAKEMIANVLHYYAIDGDIESIISVFEIANIFSECENTKSPIEQLYCIACNLVFGLRETEINFGIIMETQVPVQCRDKTYYVDFMFTPCRILSGRDYVCDEKFIVECDGHAFHKTSKEQVENDNEREYDLKMQGYNILRFSGTQIYKDPIKCANDTYDYIESVMRRKGNTWWRLNG